MCSRRRPALLAPVATHQCPLATAFVWCQYVLTCAPSPPKRYLSAYDNRVAASAPACYPSDFGVDFTWQGGTADGEQRWPSGLSLLLNKADLAVARAPAATGEKGGGTKQTGAVACCPLLLLTCALHMTSSHSEELSITTNDQCFPAAGGRMCLQDAKRAFAAFGAAGNITATEAEGPHGMMNRTRRGVYAFFQAHLQHLTNATAREDFGFAEPDMLAPYPEVIATKTGSVVDDLNSLTIHDLNREYTRDNVARLEGLRSSEKFRTFLQQLPAAATAASGYRSVRWGSSRYLFGDSDLFLSADRDLVRS